jgi:MFS superfamily sulfate permease-like transporter
MICIGASFLKLGALADFLSQPILAGYMNGIALSIMLGQLGKLFGFRIEASGILPSLLELIAKLGQSHIPTVAVGIGSFAILVTLPRVARRLPAALVLMLISALAVGLLGLDARGVKTIGDVPAGLPALVLPNVPLAELKTLLADAASIALISFTSLVLTARSFAAKNGYVVDPDRDLAALGAANIASAASQGFAVSGADSRTAMSDAAGGRTQLVGLVAAATIALILFALTGPLKHVPEAAFGRSSDPYGVFAARHEGGACAVAGGQRRVRDLDHRDARCGARRLARCDPVRRCPRAIALRAHRRPPAL